MTEKIERQRNAKSNKETCLDCGYRTRYPEHPLCPECNRRFEQMSKKIEEKDGCKMIFTRLDYAIEKGKLTLVRLKRDLAVAQRKEQEKQQRYWDKAHNDIKEQLRKELRDKLLDLSLKQSLEEIDTSQMAIPREEYNKKVGVRFNELWNAEEENTSLSRRVYGLQKAVESLERFLKSSEQQSKESEKEKPVVA